MVIMDSLILLNMTTKEQDGVPCEACGKGIYIPCHPEFQVNHSFRCNVCGAIINLDDATVVE